MLAVARFQYAGPSPELARLLRSWFDSWTGVGRIVAGMAGRSYDLQLSRFGADGWRATQGAAGRRW